jgi:hypothetical protein
VVIKLQRRRCEKNRNFWGFWGLKMGVLENTLTYTSFGLGRSWSADGQAIAWLFVFGGVSRKFLVFFPVMDD